MVVNILTGLQKNQLTAIQSTQRTIDRVQQNLATGKDVNTALQDPQSFFTSKSLDNRASDISRLLDGIFQSVQTVQQAVNGIETIDALLNQSEALLVEARNELFSSNEPGPNVILNSIDDLTSYDSGQDVGGIVEIDNAGRSLFLDGSLWKRIDFNYELTENTILRFDYKSTNIPEIAAIGFDNDNGYSNNNDRFYIYGTQGVTTSFSFNADNDYYSGSGEIETIEIPVGEFVQGNFLYLTIQNDDDGPGDDGDSLFSNITFYESDTPDNGYLPTSKIEAATQYEADYEALIEQIDLITNDANYRGINLLQRETLTTYFNEDNTSFLETAGIDATSAGLGLIELNLDTEAGLEMAIDRIKNARTQLREYTATLQNNLSVITTRQVFSESLINTLKSGSDDLVLADLNAEGAKLLSTQVRQQIQFNTLSFSANTPNITQVI